MGHRNLRSHHGALRVRDEIRPCRDTHHRHRVQGTDGQRGDEERIRDEVSLRLQGFNTDKGFRENQGQ